MSAARSAVEDLEAQLELLAEAQRIGRFGTFSADLVTGAFSFSPACLEIWGVASSEELVERWRELVHPDDAARTAGAWRTTLTEGGYHQCELRITRPDGAKRRIVRSAKATVAADGTPLRVVGTHADVTALADARDRAEAARIEVEQARVRFAAMVEHSNDLTMILDAAGRIDYLSPAWRSLTGGDPSAALGEVFADHLDPADRDAFAAATRELLRHGDRPLRCSFRMRHLAGGWRHVEQVMVNRLDDPAVGGIVCNSRDVTERVLIAQRLTHQALHDLVTGLPNRALLVDRLALALTRSARAGTQVATFFVDLDRFKQINDTLGHRAGDVVLHTVANRLSTATRDEDTVARIGGDEFVVVVEGIAEPTEVAEVAERIRSAVAQPLSAGGSTVVTTASVGIALSDEASTPEELIQHADLALYRAKERGRNRSEVYRRHMRHRAQQRMATEQLIRSNLDDGCLQVAFQPVIDLRSGRVAGHEALARLRRGDGDMVAPARFVKVAEESGLIVDVDSAVVRRACAQQAAWAGSADDPGVMSVNMSAQRLAAPGFADLVATTLADLALEPGSLCIEITESALIDSGPAARRPLEALKELGVHLALDDFGTGYSSLTYLRRFPIDAIKVDRSFVAGLGEGMTDDLEVVRAVIDLGHSLHLLVVAEGVETDAQLAVLRELDCDFGQGYLFGRPEVPGSAAER